MVGLAMDGRRLNGIDADALDAEVDREVAVGLEARDIVGGITGIEQMLAPQILRKAGEGEPVPRHLGLEPVPVVLRRMVLRVGVTVEAAQLEPVELQFLQRRQHRRERNRALAVGADIVGPGPDRGPLHGRPPCAALRGRSRCRTRYRTRPGGGMAKLGGSAGEIEAEHGAGRDGEAEPGRHAPPHAPRPLDSRAVTPAVQQPVGGRSTNAPPRRFDPALPGRAEPVGPLQLAQPAGEGARADDSRRAGARRPMPCRRAAPCPPDARRARPRRGPRRGGAHSA